MLNDQHFKILLYESDSSKIFPNTTITGGLVISYRDNNKNFDTYQSYLELYGQLRESYEGEIDGFLQEDQED